ncbi:MAG: histidine triad nucleotide-binding protein [Candidatus Aminicenantales bacterium]
MQNCLFCKMVKREIPTKVVFENERLLAFEDINPQAPVHILLIPKGHFDSLKEIPEEKKDILAEILLQARKIAEEKGISENGFRIVLNTGKDSGQAVFHIHFHLLGGRRMQWPPG